MRRTTGGRALRRQLLTMLAALCLLLPNASTVLGADEPDWKYWLDSASPLVGSRTWILEGEKLAQGRCRYTYTSEEAALPEAGYVIRSIALDPDRCLKLMEEGSPTAVQDADPSAPGLAAATKRYAWQRVYWADVVNDVLTHTITQIGWTYDGSTVTTCSVRDLRYWKWETGWRLVDFDDALLLRSSSCRVETSATYVNSDFCWPFPKVWTYYHYNRMWGHPEGHATRSQSSDSVDECLPLHYGIQSGYGTY